MKSNNLFLFCSEFLPKPMTRLSFLLITLLAQAYCFAQNSIDLFTIGGHYSFPQNFEDNSLPRGKEHIWHMNLKAPIVLSKTNTWYNEVSYYNFRLNGNDETPANIAGPVNLHGVVMQTGLVHRLDNNHALMLLFVPRLMGDLKSGDGKNVQYGGIALYEKRFNESLTMRFGASFNRELFGPFAVPLVYLRWQLSDKWQMVGLLPVYGKIIRRVSDDLAVGLHYFGLVTTYRLEHELYAGDYMERRSIDFSLFARHRIANNIHFEIRGGFALGRDYQQYGENDQVDFALPLINFGDNREQKNISFAGGPFIRGQLVYNLVLE